MFLGFLFLSLPLHPRAAPQPPLIGGPYPAKDRQRVLDHTYGLFETYGIDFLFSPPQLWMGAWNQHVSQLSFTSDMEQIELTFWNHFIPIVESVWKCQVFWISGVQHILTFEAPRSSPGNMQSSKSQLTPRCVTTFGRGWCLARGSPGPARARAQTSWWEPAPEDMQCKGRNWGGTQEQGSPVLQLLMCLVVFFNFLSTFYYRKCGWRIVHSHSPATPPSSSNHQQAPEIQAVAHCPGLPPH